MIYGAGYVSDNGGQFRWEQYLEWNKLIPVHASDSLISETVKKIQDKTDCYVDSFAGNSYLIQGVLIQHVTSPRMDNDPGILSFQSDLRFNLEKVISSFNLPLPAALERISPAKQ